MARSIVHAVTAIGIDMGKTTLHMVGLDSRGAIAVREKVSRGRIASRLANLPPCLIGIEACEKPARAILVRPANWPKHGFGAWLVRAVRRLHPNVLAVALANKLARIAWTVLAQEPSYEARVMK
jgi:transposase